MTLSTPTARQHILYADDAQISISRMNLSSE